MAVRRTSPGKLNLWEDATCTIRRTPPSTKKKAKAVQKEPQEEGTNEHKANRQNRAQEVNGPLRALQPSSRQTESGKGIHLKIMMN